MREVKEQQNSRAVEREFGSRVSLFCSVALLFFCALFCHCGSVSAADTIEPMPVVVPVDGKAFGAKLVSIGADGRFTFQPEAGENSSAAGLRTLAAGDLVRWGRPALAAAQPLVLLVDRSRLVAAADWSGGAAVRVDGDEIIVRSDDWGDVRLSRSAVRGIVFAQRSSPSDRRKLEDLVWAADVTQDQVLLANQDRLTGAVKELPGGSITMATAGGDAKLPLSRVEAVIFTKAKETGGSAEPRPQPPGGQLVVGMRDGSLLYATHVAADDHRVELELAGGQRLAGASIAEIVSLQSLGGQFVYLSDLEPANYRHVPYLDIEWPYKRDRNVLGEPLVVEGKQYLKGLGMHSAARLTYKLERQYQRFNAEVAIDDSAGRRGSVLFGVYVLRDAKWQPAYTSDTVRGGDMPKSVAIDVMGADAITLVVDYADRGDELDHADWLDARLTK
jgi:NPCBM/NEW2 domain